MIWGTTDHSRGWAFLKQYSWHTWFAWRPVHLLDGRWAWLQTVRRRRYDEGGYDGAIGKWSYDATDR